MTLFVLTCLDRSDAGDLRAATRAAHLAYLQGASVKIKVAGPILDDQGRIKGSLYVLDTDDRAAVERFTTNDPYSRAGLFGRVEILSWRVTVGALG